MSASKKEHKKSADEEDFTDLLHEREQDTDLDEQLAHMYAANNGDGSTVQRDTNSPWKRIGILFVVLLALLSAVSWASFFLLNEQRLGGGDSVSVDIAGPEELQAGQEAVYEIRYRNTGEFSLQDAVLELTVPPQAYVVDAAPAYDETAPPAGRTLRWQLAPVAGRYKGKVEVKLMAIGETDTEIPLNAHIRYRPENFSSAFSAQAAVTPTIAETGLHARGEAPSFVNVNDDVSVTLTYAKTQASLLDEAFVWLEYGEYFQPLEPESLPVALATIAETPQEMELKGKFTAMPRAGEGVTVYVGVPTPAGAEEPYAPVFQYDWQPTVVSGALQLSTTVNGSAAGRPVNFGDTLQYVLHYKNSSDTALEQVALLATIDSPLVDWDTLVNARGGEVRGNALLWTAEEVGNLAHLAPDAEGSISFSIGVKGLAATAQAPSANERITLKADYSIGGDPAERDTPAAQISAPVNSNFALAETLRYFGTDGSRVGSGPWPPQVGERSTVQAQWALTNSWHDLENIEVVATLPDSVEWSGAPKAHAGTITYNEKTRTVRWTIGRLQAESEPAVATFPIAIVPAAGQRGSLAPLLSETRAEAKDSATGGVIVRTAPAVTTALPHDASAPDGTVR